MRYYIITYFIYISVRACDEAEREEVIDAADAREMQHFRAYDDYTIIFGYYAAGVSGQAELIIILRVIAAANTKSFSPF